MSAPVDSPNVHAFDAVLQGLIDNLTANKELWEKQEAAYREAYREDTHEEVMAHYFFGKVQATWEALKLLKAAQAELFDAT